MRILKLQLRNVKSYGDDAPEIDLAAGVNFLTGLNGAGKSTIIESLGYVLYGFLNCRKEDFLRRGAKMGTITVWVEHDQETFRIVRKFGSNDSWVVYDKDDVALCDKRDDVLKFLCERLHVRDSKQLENVFSHMIGVQQGMFTAVFKLGGAERKKILDGIIDVNSYREASDSRAAVKNQLVNKEITGLKVQVANLRTYIAEHENDPKKLADLQGRLKDLAAQLTQLSERRTKLQDRKKAIDVVKGKIEGLDQELHGLEIKIKESQAALEGARRESKRAHDSSKLCEQAKKGHEAFQKAEDDSAILEKKRVQRDNLARQLQQIETQIVADNEAIEGSEGELKKRRESEQELEQELQQAEKAWKVEEDEACTAKDAADKASKSHEQVSGAYETIRKAEAGFLERLEKAKASAEAIAGYLDEVARLDKVLEKYEEVEKLAETADGSRQKAKSVDSKITRMESEIETHQKNKKELASLSCPFIRAKCDRVGPEVFNEMISDLREKVKLLEKDAEEAAGVAKVAGQAEKRLEALKASKEERGRAVAGVRREREKARVALEGFKPSWGKYPDFPSDTEKAPDLAAFTRYGRDWGTELDRRGLEVKAHAKAEKDAIGRAEGRRNRADAALKGVDGIRKRCETLKKDLATREKAIIDRKKKFSESTVRKGAVSKELEVYKSLDADLGRLRAVIEANRADHKAYLANEPVAKELGKWEKLVKQHESAIAQALLRQEAARKDRALAAQGYDVAEANRVAAELEEVVGLVGAAQEERRGLEERRAELEKSVGGLRKAQTDLVLAEKERKRLERFQQVLEDVWKILRELGPRVANRLLAGISARANRVFSLLHGAPGRLEWGKDYEVRFKQGTTDLPFTGLSGGEQMSAALAIQMAMARDFAGSSFCIFDEPTVHLDPDRRARLAGAIREAQVDAGFSQVFVVSHDDTFGPHVDHEIKLRKVLGAGTEVIT